MKIKIFILFLFNTILSYSTDNCEIYKNILDFIKDSVHSSFKYEKMRLLNDGFKHVLTDCSFDTSYFCMDSIGFYADDTIFPPKTIREDPLVILFIPIVKNDEITATAYIYWIPQVRLELYFKIKRRDDDYYIQSCISRLKM